MTGSGLTTLVVPIEIEPGCVFVCKLTGKGPVFTGDRTLPHRLNTSEHGGSGIVRESQSVKLVRREVVALSLPGKVEVKVKYERGRPVPVQSHTALFVGPSLANKGRGVTVDRDGCEHVRPFQKALAINLNVHDTQRAQSLIIILPCWYHRLAMPTCAKVESLAGHCRPDEFDKSRPTHVTTDVIS